MVGKNDQNLARGQKEYEPSLKIQLACLALIADLRKMSDYGDQNDALARAERQGRCTPPKLERAPWPGSSEEPTYKSEDIDALLIGGPVVVASHDANMKDVAQKLGLNVIDPVNDE